jgi:hypothetical protein
MHDDLSSWLRCEKDVCRDFFALRIMAQCEEWTVKEAECPI